jgi:nucleoside-diphosphate-sugar epimerase
MRIAVTGGSGRIGSFTIRELLANGYEVRNLDHRPPEERHCPFTRVDMMDFGEVVDTLRGFEAVVHMAAIPAPIGHSNNLVYRNNTQSTFNVLEAASILGIRKLCLASSINAVGASFNRERHFRYLPLDEDHPCSPDEAYGLSKLEGEIAANGFALRYREMTLCSMRYPAVILPDGYADVPGRESGRYRTLFAYVDIREAARANRLALEVEWTGHEAFFINADHIFSTQPTAEMLAEYYPEVPLNREFGKWEAPICTEKAERLLGWRHAFDYRERKDA